MKNGIIVSLQGYHYKTITELAQDAIRGGAVGIRTDKKPFSRFNSAVIGLNKKTVINPEKEAYITPTIEEIKKVSEWSAFVAIDCRQINERISENLLYCKMHDIRVVADIGCIADYENLLKIGLPFAFVASTFSVFRSRLTPDIQLIKDLYTEGERNIIAEGNYQTREQVREALSAGAANVCIGGAISDVYKLTRKYTTVKIKT